MICKAAIVTLIWSFSENQENYKNSFYDEKIVFCYIKITITLNCFCKGGGGVGVVKTWILWFTMLLSDTHIWSFF